MNADIQISQVLQLYSHTISNVEMMKYHQELGENVESDRKIVLEDLICLTTITSQNVFEYTSIIHDLKQATTLTQLVDTSYDTNGVINVLKNAKALVEKMN